jgi:HEAT repeat protein
MSSARPNIWKLQANRDVDGLIEALQYHDPEIRKRAAAALRVIGTTKAVFALERALATEANPYVREHLTNALSFFSQGSLIDTFIATHNITGLIEMLNSPRKDEIVKAITALGDLGDRTATEGLVMVFRNALYDDDIRLAAAEALIKLENAPAVVTLLGALKKANWQVRHNAVIVLGQLKASWATKPLAKALHDPHARVRKSAAWALKQINTTESLRQLHDYENAEARLKTTPLEGILDHTLRVDNFPTRPNRPDSQVVAGVANQEDITQIRPPRGWKEAIQAALEEAEDDLSPAMAAAEAALAQLSPHGETLFDNLPQVPDDEVVTPPDEDMEN